MSQDYATGRIKEALKRAKGNRLRAKQQVMAWAYEDTKLLHELTKAHLAGIVAYNIDRVASGRADKSKVAANKTVKPKTSKKAAAGDDQFGMEILRAAASSDGAIFGQESYAAQASRGGASKRHADTLRMLASKSRSKPDKF